jgi:hypothetical protein
VRADSDAAEDTKNRAASSGVGSREEDAGVTSPDFATLSKNNRRGFLVYTELQLLMFGSKMYFVMK